MWLNSKPHEFDSNKMRKTNQEFLSHTWWWYVNIITYAVYPYGDSYLPTIEKHKLPTKIRALGND